MKRCESRISGLSTLNIGTLLSGLIDVQATNLYPFSSSLYPFLFQSIMHEVTFSYANTSKKLTSKLRIFARFLSFKRKIFKKSQPFFRKQIMIAVSIFKKNHKYFSLEQSDFASKRRSHIRGWLSKQRVRTWNHF